MACLSVKKLLYGINHALRGLRMGEGGGQKGVIYYKTT
jgi:hypothetical protein